MTTNVRVNAGRLWTSLMDMAGIGATPKGGVRRLGLSDEDKRGRDLFRRWCERQGYQVRVDPCGNMFARRSGTVGGLKPVLIGSHLDSQPTGGKFDGAFGVLAALEALRTLDDLGMARKRLARQGKLLLLQCDETLKQCGGRSIVCHVRDAYRLTLQRSAIGGAGAAAAQAAAVTAEPIRWIALLGDFGCSAIRRR